MSLQALITIAALVLMIESGTTLGSARIGAAKQDIAGMATALDTFESDCGRYPSTVEGLAALTTPPGGVTNWKGPYLAKLPSLDPWGKPYQYAFPGSHNVRGFDLVSAGADGQLGTGDDISNWSEGTGGGSSFDWLYLFVAAVVVCIFLMLIWSPRQRADALVTQAVEDPNSDNIPIATPSPPTTPVLQMLDYRRPRRRTRSQLRWNMAFAITAGVVMIMYIPVLKCLQSLSLDSAIDALEYPGTYVWFHLQPEADYVGANVVFGNAALWSVALAIPVAWVFYRRGLKSADGGTATWKTKE